LTHISIIPLFHHSIFPEVLFMAERDELRPIYDEVSKCNKCGFCQAVCPIFDITKDEQSVARGHNAHIRKLIEGRLDLDKELKDPLFECLLCRTCVANCFPAVRTDKNIIRGRAEYMKQVGQPKVMTFLFHKLLPDQWKMAKYVRLGAFGKNAGMTKLARALGILKWFGKDFAKAEGIIEKLPTRFFRDRVQDLTLSPAKKDVKIGYFVGCGFNFVLPHVSEATVDFLVSRGVEIEVAENCCCGLPAYGYGDLEAARKMAAKNMEILEKMDVDIIMTECASCSSMLKDYPELFEEDPEMRERAERLAGRVQGFSEFMHDRMPDTPPAAGMDVKVTFHDPCHLCRYQKIVREPRAILKHIPGVTFVEMSEADRCCGAAGSYNIMHYEQSMQVLDRKVKHIKNADVDVLTTECPGCQIQLGYGVRRAGLPTRVMHLSQLLSEVYLGKKAVKSAA
jgi:glycolate oxidase iron-sulfur subunit